MTAARTDLALEQATNLAPEEAIPITRRGKTFRISELHITEKALSQRIGRGIGRYITLECDRLSRSSDILQIQAEELATEIAQLLPEGDILVVGLGNADITPDALGPLVAGKILATRHLRRELQINSADMEYLHNLRPVSVLANGVLGQTGIETAELTAALRDTIKPAAVIAVDALACSDINRLGCTIQISDAGISPGSGVQNRRKALDEASLGVPVIAIGVPTVVDMHTIVRHYTDFQDDSLPNMMVTPRDVDCLVANAAKLIAYGINLALQPTMNFSDLEGLA